MPKKSFRHIKPLPGWLEELEKAKQEIRRQEELNGLYAWKTGGAYALTGFEKGGSNITIAASPHNTDTSFTAG